MSGVHKRIQATAKSAAPDASRCAYKERNLIILLSHSKIFFVR
jgi:hypothetical protein